MEVCGSGGREVATLGRDWSNALRAKLAKSMWGGSGIRSSPVAVHRTKLAHFSVYINMYFDELFLILNFVYFDSVPIFTL